MPAGRVIVEVEWPSNDALPRDTFDNTFYFVKPAGAIVAGDGPAIITALTDFYNSVTPYYSPFVGTAADVKMYNEDEVRAAGTPRTILYEGSIPKEPSHGGTPLPEEIALCLSYHSGAGNIVRHRGRVYLGPFNSTALELGSEFDGTLNMSRPLNAMLNDIGNAASALTTDVALGGTITWALKSRIGTGTKLAPVAEYEPITAGHVDNEWDGQRRRRIAASHRVLF